MPPPNITPNGGIKKLKNHFIKSSLDFILVIQRMTLLICRLIFLSTISGAVRHQPNNWLYRSGLDPLSATNLCYAIYYTTVHAIVDPKYFLCNTNYEYLFSSSYGEYRCLHLDELQWILYLHLYHQV